VPVRPVVALPDPILKAVASPFGVGRRAFVMDVTGHKKAQSCHGQVVLFDPEILLAHGPVVAREGCMSVPHHTGDVSRATRVVVRGIDVDGRDRVIQADAFEARALLHEIDHLDGVLFLDRVSSHTAVFRRKIYR
jgi:peptide deformylase